MEGLSEYEKRRLENIRNNQKVLEALAIPLLPLETTINQGDKTKKSAPSTAKRRLANRVITEEPAPRRVSARLQNKATGESNKLSLSEELAMYKEISGQEEKPRPKRVLGNITFDPENGATDVFIDLMSSAMASKRDPTLPSTNSPSGSRSYRIDGTFSVAKVVKERIYSMALHPSCEKIIVSAGSKAGGLGIWDATAAWEGTAESRSTFYFTPHSAAISNQRYHPTNSGQLIMTSYDGVLRCLDIVKGHFSELYHAKAQEDQLIAGFDMTRDGNVLYFTDMDGALTRVDPRSGKTQSFQLHEKKAGGFSISPADNNYCATSSLDTSVCIWDMRMLQPFGTDMVSRFEYGRAVTSVQFHPVIRDALVSTCYDDSVRLHRGVIEPSEKAIELRIKHNNQTGRWITPFRAIWDPKSTDEEHSHVIVGNMNRGLDLIQMHDGYMTNSLSELLTAQPAVNAIHPTLDLIVSGTGSGKCILWKPS